MTTTTDPAVSPRFAPRAAVLDQARRGDRHAFSRLMEPYRRELVAYCYRLTRSLPEAEDLAQEAFVRAFRALDSFQGRATPRAWLSWATARTARAFAAGSASEVRVVQAATRAKPWA